MVHFTVRDESSLQWRLALSTLGSVESNGLDAPGVALRVLLEPLVVQPVHFSLPRSLSLRSPHDQQVCKKTGHRMKCPVGRLTASVLSVLLTAQRCVQVRLRNTPCYVRGHVNVK